MTIAPLAARSARWASRASRNVEVRLVSSTRCQSSSVSLRSGRRMQHAGIGDDRVEPAEAFEREAHGIAHRVLVGGVAFDGGRRARPAAELLHQPRLRQIERRHAPAGVEQMQRNGAADALRRPGDERDRAGPPAPAHASAIAPSLVLRGDRQIRPPAPFGPGAVVERLRRLADGVEREPQRCGGDARAAAGDDRLVEVDAAGGEFLPDLVGRRSAGRPRSARSPARSWRPAYARSGCPAAARALRRGSAWRAAHRPPGRTCRAAPSARRRRRRPPRCSARR